jgi:AcrR family transcriptional regulator
MRIAADHREAVLREAARLFAQKPFHEVRMDEVAERVGVAKGTLYRCYRDKQSLCVAICLSWMAELRAEMRAAAAARPDGRGRLEEIVFRMLERHRARRDFYQCSLRMEGLAAMLSNPEFMKQREATRRLIAGVIAAGAARGEFRKVDAGFAANLLLGMLRSHWRWGDPRTPSKVVTRRILDLFLHGLAAGERTGKGP